VGESKDKADEMARVLCSGCTRGMSNRSEAVLLRYASTELNFSATQTWHLPAENSQLGKGFVVCEIDLQWSNETLTSHLWIQYPLRSTTLRSQLSEAGDGVLYRRLPRTAGTGGWRHEHYIMPLY
jgi:hypothetical protein